MPNARCEIIGVGVLDGELRAQVERLGLGRSVILPGPQPQGEVRAKLRQASVLAAPCVIAADGDRDGLPTVLLEAMAMGTPVVSTDVTGIPEVLEDGDQCAQADRGAVRHSPEQRRVAKPLRSTSAGRAGLVRLRT